MTPSLTPSMLSQAVIAAVVAAASLHAGTGLFTAFMRIAPHSSCGMNLDQLIAGDAETMPS